MRNGILIFGLNGCGKTSLAGALAERLSYLHMDIEDYYFMPSTIPYTKPRSKVIYEEMMLSDMKKYDYVFSSLNGDYSPEIISTCTLAIHLNVPKAERLKRVRLRAIKQHGDRIEEGGDMHEAHLDFLKVVKLKTDDIQSWSASLTCPILELDGCKPISHNVRLIVNYLLQDQGL